MSGDRTPALRMEPGSVVTSAGPSGGNRPPRPPVGVRSFQLSPRVPAPTAGQELRGQLGPLSQSQTDRDGRDQHPCPRGSHTGTVKVGWGHQALPEPPVTLSHGEPFFLQVKVRRARLPHNASRCALKSTK